MSSQIDTSALLPSIAPQGGGAGEYQRVQTSPETFGAGFGKTLEQVGQDASQVGKFFGDIAADDGYNQLASHVTKLTHGDPTKMVTGPDGQQTQDTGYMGLRGRAALDARPQVMQSIDDKIAKIREGLQSNDQRFKFDQYSRHLRTQTAQQVGTWADSQAKEWGQTTNKSAADLAVNRIAANSDDPEIVKTETDNLIHAHVKAAQLNGAKPGDAQYDDAIVTGSKVAIGAQVIAIGTKDPERALTLLEANKKLAGDKYDELLKVAQANVTKFFVSKADAMAVDDPMHVEQYVRDHEKQIGPDYFGQALERAHRAQIEGGGKSLAVQSDAAVGSGKPPRTTVAASSKPPMVLGDSLGEGIKTAGKLQGDTLVGRSSAATLDVIKSLPENPDGRPIVLSSGLSNDGDRQNPQIVKVQIDQLKAKGYHDIRIVGVGDKFSDLNPKIKAIAEANGATFVPLGKNDGVHSTDGYASVTKAALGGGGAPGGITSGPAANIDSSIPAEGRALLATISGPESAGRYNVRYGGASFDGYGDHPRAKSTIWAGPNQGLTSDAAGRYQFLSRTWDSVKSQAGLTDFSPASQDKGAWWLAQSDYKKRTGRDLLPDLRSGDPATLNRVADALRPTWTSLPGGIEAGTTQGKFEKAYQAALSGSGATPAAAPRGSAVATGEPTPEPAAFSPTPPVSPALQTPEQIQAAIYDQSARRLQWIDAQDVPNEQKDAAKRQVSQDQAFMLAAAGAQQNEIRAREEIASNDVLGSARKEGFDAAYKKLNAYMADPSQPITEKQYELLNNTLEHRFGNPNPRVMGDGYTAAMDGLLADRGSPNYIGTYRQVLELERAGKLTSRGSDEVEKHRKMLEKSEDEYGIQAMANEGRKQLETELTAGGMDPLTGKPVDPHGAELYRTAGIRLYDNALTAWRQAVHEGKADPTSFPLSDPKKLKALANSIYPTQERAYMRLQAQQPGLPDIPDFVDPKGWGDVYGLAKANADKFGEALVRLASNPATEAPLWDAQKLGKVISAKDALEKMGVPYRAPPPGRPHTITPASFTGEPAPASGKTSYGAITSTNPEEAAALQHFVTIGPANPDWHLFNPALRRDIMHIRDLFSDAHKEFEQFKRTRSTGPTPQPPIYAPPPRESE